MIERLAFESSNLQSRRGSRTGALMNSSEDLIARARDGDQEAFRLIFERYARPVLSFIHDLVGRRDLAEELTQETFVRAYRKLKELRDETKFSSWLFGIGKNVAREALRSTRNERSDPGDHGLSARVCEDQTESPVEQLLGKELNAAVCSALATLDQDKKMVFALRIFQQRSYSEIMEITGFSLAKVKTELHRARIEMRQQIRPFLERSK